MPTKEKSEEICFVVSAIGKPDSPTRLRANEVLEFIISPAVQECGYRAVRADGIIEPGVITTDMINHLIEAPLVIADLTERNPNVYYEIGVRHAFDMPVILISEEPELPFDVQSIRTIQFNHTSLTSANDCKRQIIDQIKAIRTGSAKRSNPISQVATLQALKSSDNPVEEILLELQIQFNELASQVHRMSEKVLPSTSSPFGSVRPTVPGSTTFGGNRPAAPGGSSSFGSGSSPFGSKPASPAPPKNSSPPQFSAFKVVEDDDSEVTPEPPSPFLSPKDLPKAPTKKPSTKSKQD